MVLLFCHFCGVRLSLEEGPKCYRFYCKTCPYVYNVNHKMVDRKYPRLKEVDEILTDSKVWDSVEKTGIKCPKCEYHEAYWMAIQTRSADEPMTNFYRCANKECTYRWKE